jgi:AcrR family transcriptional regulator
MDRLLIETGRRLLPKKGAAKLSLREVAEKAGVNLGMFHYHFGTKDEFVRRVLQEIYEEFFSELDQEFRTGVEVRDPVERAKAMFKTAIRFVLAHRELIASVLQDVLSGEKVALEFITANFPRHFNLIHQAVAEAQKHGGFGKDQPPIQIMILCMFTTVVPVILATAGGRIAPAPVRGMLEGLFLSEAVIERRLDSVFRGLTP